MKSSTGKDETFEYKFNPLKQLSASEKAEIQSKNATRDALYESLRVINSADIQAALVEEQIYPTLTPERLEAENSNVKAVELEKIDFTNHKEIISKILYMHDLEELLKKISGLRVL